MQNCKVTTGSMCRVWEMMLATTLGITASLFSFCLLKARHKDELIQETPVLRTVKDWIAADFETWDKVLKNKDEGSYRITVSGGEGKNSSSKRSKK